MSPLLQLVKFSSKPSQSGSVLVDVQHVHVRNLLLFCTSLSMMRLLFGETIHCQNTVGSLSQIFIDTKCYINGTVTKSTRGRNLYHDYYQWVSVYLLLLALGFHFPYSIWFRMFGNYLNYLENLKDDPDEAIRVICHSKGYHLFFKVWALEIFYIVEWVVFLMGTDKFFNHYWSIFTWSWNTIDALFPDEGTCAFVYHHSSGQTQASFKCLLPLSSVYRKVFRILYGVTVILITLNGVVMLYRIVLVIRVRKRINAWWTLSRMKQRAVSWDAEEKFKLALKGRTCQEFEIETEV